MEGKADIILYFGSFNPPHNGHTAVANYVCTRGLCEELCFVVSPRNPFKSSEMLAPDHDRLEMTRIAVMETLPGLPVKVSDVEFGLPKPSYTIDTLRSLDKECPNREFSLLGGADLLKDIHNWKESGALLDGYRFYIYPRTGYDYTGGDPNMIFMEDAPVFDYSSTDVREAWSNAQDIGHMVCPGVLKYIEDHDLWKTKDL